MTDFTRKSIMPVYKFSINYKPAAKSGTECNYNKVLHSFGTSVYHLSNSRCICIVCNNDRQVCAPVKNLCQRNYSFPWKACCIFYCSFIDIPHRGPYSKSYYFYPIPNLTGCNLNLFIQCCYKYFNFVIMSGFYPVLSQNISFPVDKTKDCICTSYINPNCYLFFCHFLKMNNLLSADLSNQDIT